METGGINKVSSQMSYEIKQFSGSVKSTYGKDSSEESGQIQKNIDINAVISSFKVDASSNTFDSLKNQSELLERLGIGTAISTSDDSNIFSPKIQSQDDLFGENGYWGVKKTAARISEFVLSGAGEDIEKLKAGREGIQRGLKEAEKVWGGKMPDIAYQTIEKSLESIDEKIKKLGGNVVDITA